jgi:hypothetical protein
MTMKTISVGELLRTGRTRGVALEVALVLE